MTRTCSPPSRDGALQPRRMLGKSKGVAAWPNTGRWHIGQMAWTPCASPDPTTQRRVPSGSFFNFILSIFILTVLSHEITKKGRNYIDNACAHALTIVYYNTLFSYCKAIFAQKRNLIYTKRAMCSDIADAVIFA